MILAVRLRGLPEAVLAADRVTVDLPSPITAEAVARAVAACSPRLREALLRSDGTPRTTTKVLLNGTPVDATTRVDDARQVALLAVFPCDG